MKQKLNISIPEPCHEDWNKMTPTEKGKFCGVCTKEVVNFTSFSDEQLIKYFNKNKKLCGHFNKDQLNRDLVLARRDNRSIPSYIVAGLFSLFLLNSNTTKAQEKPKTEQSDKKYTSIPLSNTLAKDSITVSGIVVDENNIFLPGATVMVKGTTNGTVTDFDGKFNLDCNIGETLEISYIGYETTHYVVTTKNNISIKLTENYELEGEVIIMESKRRWITGNLFTRLTNIFRKEKKNPKYRY